MALTDSFLATCRVAINALPELTAFRTAVALTTDSLVGRRAAYGRAYGAATSTPSPAYDLARAIVDTVNAQADAAGTLGLLDRGGAVATLTAEYLPPADRPNSEAEEEAEQLKLIREDQLS